ncbi:anthranilate/aminodeoxychorismate synthase component II [Chromatiales bacterium (ex Bugula neritina AB1)]|nr:anthranilate/aminodeoxychorismate synthase component II [Chromatiales bacterium (ex Bugula neritina AB1)]
MLTMLDNYDSFTFNLVQYLGELGADINVVRNDCVTVQQIVDAEPAHLVVSPGPCTPDKAGISVELIRRMAGQIPVFGVCLGHQCIGAAFGAKIVSAGQIMHGKTSLVYHQGAGVFSGLPSPFTVTRYHSLVIEQDKLPDCLEITAWTQNDNGEVEEIMGVRHRSLDVEGVQFHPESILTEHGHSMLNSFLMRSSL